MQLSTSSSPLALVLVLGLATTHLSAMATEVASYAVETKIEMASDRRNRGISDSMMQPGLKLSVQLAHESGFVGLAEVGTVSKKQFLGGAGYSLLFAGGWRRGDPDGWHFGAGAAREIFPGAQFEAPHALDLGTFVPADMRRTGYGSSYAIFELGYDAIEGRVLHVLSRTYRGVNTGGVCGTMLALRTDPNVAVECYQRGDNDSRGSWLFDIAYKHTLTAATTLNVHAGHQHIKHFSEANLSDASIGLAHRRWGYQWSVEGTFTWTRVHELYLYADDGRLRATDGNRIVASVSRTF